MRISYLLPRCDPENSHGRYVIELAKRLSNDHAVTIFSGKFWPPLRRMVQCRFIPVPNRPALARLATLWAYSPVLAPNRSNGVVHIQGADAPIGNVVTAHFCNAAFNKVVDRRSGPLRHLNSLVGAAAERFCMARPSTRTIIAVSQVVKQEVVREYRVHPSRIVVIPHGVDLDAFNPRHREEVGPRTRAQLGLGTDDFMVLFVGGDYRRKGLPTLLAATATMTTRVMVVTVGVKPGTDLTRLVEDAGMVHRIKFIPPTSDIAPLYAAADCFALPTSYDPFSLATLEAMASGTPVVVSKAAGVAEHLTHELDCLLLQKAHDVRETRDQLTRLLEDQGLRHGFGEQARCTAERFSWDAVVERTLSVYQRAID